MLLSITATVLPFLVAFAINCEQAIGFSKDSLAEATEQSPHQDSSRHFLRLLIDKSFDRAVKAFPLRYTKLLQAILQRSGNLASLSRDYLPLLLSFRNHQYATLSKSMFARAASRSQLRRGLQACRRTTILCDCRMQAGTSMAVARLIAPVALPNASNSLSVLSYNVLLPNSIDAWWTYKMYSPALSESNRHIASWDYRRELLKRRISLVNADVVCLQEVSPESFESDFAFMAELGYDGVELHRRNRFRPATFWKSAKLNLASPSVHKDRTLLTAFQMNGQQRPWFVLNCHLQAGRQGKRRVQQIHEGTKAIVNLAKKLQVLDPASGLQVIVCGDFNGGSECGAVRYLEDGLVDSDFVEDANAVTSKRKEIPMALAPFHDVMETHPRKPPPTLVVSELISRLVKEGNGYENPVLSDSVVERLARIYKRRATQKVDRVEKQMSLNDVEKWLIDINGKSCRGDEFREAARQMGWKAPADTEELSESELKHLITLPVGGVLSLEGFIAVYQAELEQGKFWGIHHDLTILGEPLQDLGIFTARFDRMYHSGSIGVEATIDFDCGRACPNDLEPSDHLPVAASFVVAH